MVGDNYDAIIVGSGAGGAAAAYALVGGGLRVLLLEKGGVLPQDGSTLDVQRVVGQGEFLSREVWRDGRGMRLVPEEHFNVGGKTKWYGAALLRFAAREFEPDAVHGCRGWPIEASALTAYYEQAERLLGVRTFECEADLAKILARACPHGSGWDAEPMPLGLAADILHEPMEAMRFDGFASARDLKGDADTAFLRPLRSESRMTLMTGAEVSGLIGSAESPRQIIGVRLRDQREFRAPVVLLAAGALHSPRLLGDYLSERGLTQELPVARQIGRNLKLHLLTAMLGFSRRRLGDALRKTVVLTNARFPHSSVQPLGFDAELITALVPKWIPGLLSMQFGARAYGFFLQTEDGSATDNCVRTEGSVPVLDYSDERVPAARHEHQTLRGAFQRALARAGLLAIPQRIGLSGTAHACGTLVCGHSAADSVVDAEGRVHGLDGLYVVDGSILPRSSRVNPSLTIYAWALRCAGLIVTQAQRRGQSRTLGERSHVQ